MTCDALRVESLWVRILMSKASVDVWFPCSLPSYRNGVCVSACLNWEETVELAGDRMFT